MKMHSFTMKFKKQNTSLVALGDCSGTNSLSGKVRNKEKESDFICTVFWSSQIVNEGKFFVDLKCKRGVRIRKLPFCKVLMKLWI